MAENENWTPVVGYEGLYDISDHGDVRRWGRCLKPYLNANGYFTVSLSKRAKVKKFLVHRLVAAAFHGPPPLPKLDAAHWNGNKTDNRAANLRWATRAENMADTERLGRTAKGGRNGQAKLSEADVLLMRQMRKDGMTYQALAEHFAIRWQTAQDACKGRNWKHLTGCLAQRSRRSPTFSQAL